MNKTYTYWDIYNYRLKEALNTTETNAINNPGTTRAVLFFIPYVATISLFEFVWKSLFGKNRK